jgi:putative PIN family toxin of toxin-antitoxin system
MPNVVFDTVVFVRSLINPHSIWGNLVYTYKAKYTLYLSIPVIKEIVEVIERPKLKQKYHTTQEHGIRQLLQILFHANVVDIETIPTASRDIKDDKFLATAKAAKADYLVSEDQDLLTLKEYEGTQIVNAETFLKVLERIFKEARP